MKILHTTPAQDGFYMPAEFAPHEGCLMIWPERADSWQYGAYAARKAFLRVIETISESESMTVLCSEGQYDNARAQLPDRVRLVVMETDDAWARDVGPTFVINGKGERRGIDWGFNTWGGEVDGLYPSWENDNRVARKFCNLLGNDVYDKRDFICESSSIHADGENDPQYALSNPRPDTMLAAWKNWRSTKAADSRTGAQGRARARNNALWTVLAVLMMESINEEKTSLYKKKRLPYDCIHRKILHIHHWHRRFSACFLLHYLRTAGKWEMGQPLSPIS